MTNAKVWLEKFKIYCLCRGATVKMTYVQNCFSILILSLILYPVLKHIIIYDIEDISYCPLCNGQDLCKIFIDNKIAYTWNFILDNLINMALRKEKRIIFTPYNNDIIVLKIFKRTAILVNSKHISSVSINNDLHVRSSSIVMLLKHLTKPDFLNPSQKLKICPTPDKINFLLLPLITETSNANLTELYMKALYMIQVNVEPIVQKVLKGTAIAEYLGGCGAIAVSEYCGGSLTNVLPKMGWKERSSVANQLLKFAFNATFNHPQFAFYFTDMSPDNFAVSSKGEVKLVDLDNVIVVDKHPKEQIDNWKEWHQSFHDNSLNGFGFSPDEVCSHQISDLNVYAICQGILLEQPANLLDGGILSSPPQHMSHITHLVQECISPSTRESRFQIAQLIINALEVA